MPRRARGLRTDNIWPGFVDALATLLLVIIFLLVVFMLAHFFLSQALTGRDEALQRLNDRISELSSLLSMERQTVTDMRLSVSQLSASLQSANLEREELNIKLRDSNIRADEAVAALTNAKQSIEVSRETISVRLAEIERLNRDILALREVRDDLEDEVAVLAVARDNAENDADRLAGELSNAKFDEQQLEDNLRAVRMELSTSRDFSKELESKLSTQVEQTLLSQKELEEREIRLAELENLFNRSNNKIDEMSQEISLISLDRTITQQELKERSIQLSDTQQELEERSIQLSEEQLISLEAKQEIVLLNQQLNQIRIQLQSIQTALDASEELDKEQKVEIQTLGNRLNAALASKVDELTTYRSEFFGKLRQVLGSRSEIEIVGDRFVFQSEVLFDPGQAEIGLAGEEQLASLARTLTEISETIPVDINWVLRVDGHTDIQPINTPLFPSNWELSTARAVSVVKYLIDRGIPANRLAATGFGQYQPLDERPIEAAYRKNRRIELKLTER